MVSPFVSSTDRARGGFYASPGPVSTVLCCSGSAVPPLPCRLCIGSDLVTTDRTHHARAAVCRSKRRPRRERRRGGRGHREPSSVAGAAQERQDETGSQDRRGFPERPPHSERSWASRTPRISPSSHTA